MEKEKILGVFEPEVAGFLKKIGIYQAVTDGSICCEYCKKIITENNFGSYIKIKGILYISCDDQECIIKNGSRKET